MRRSSGKRSSGIDVRAEPGGRRKSPRNRKNSCRKMVLFPKALFLVTNLRKEIKNKKIQFFYRIFIKNFQNFHSISQQCVFSTNAQKINAQFANFFEKYAKIMHFLQFSEETFSKFSKVFSKIPINCLFRPNAQKINEQFVKFI